MNFAAVYHRSTPDMCYSPDGNEIVINIRTDRDVDAVYLVHEDPFIHELNRKSEWYGRRERMSLSRELRYQVIYTLKVRPEYKRLMYYFELEADGRTYCLVRVAQSVRHNRAAEVGGRHGVVPDHARPFLPPP